MAQQLSPEELASFKDKDIIPAIKGAFDSGKPACINVVTDNSVTSPATVIFYQKLSDF